MKSLLILLISLTITTGVCNLFPQETTIKTKTYSNEKNYLDLGIYNLGFDLSTTRNEMVKLKDIWINNSKTPLLGAQQFSNIIINFDYNKTDPIFIAEHQQIVESISMAFFTQFIKAYKVVIKENKGVISHFASDEGDIFLSFVKPQ